MDWFFESIDGYCERLGPDLWAEPVNAITNLAFIVMGVFMWRRTRGLSEGRALSIILVIIGVASMLFHTIAQGWTAALDSLPIMAFALTYIYLANRDFWQFSALMSALGTALYIPYTMLLTPVFGAVPGFSISAFYWPLPLLIAAYGLLLLRRSKRLGRGLLTGAAILTVSLVFRSLDEPTCAATHIGTHFLWHILNAAMLAWMIEVWRVHVVLEGRVPTR